jgi:hypothetical protein
VVLLSVADFKTFVPVPGVTDAALSTLLDAAEQAIVGRYGASGNVTEIHDDGGGLYIFLGRRAASITSVTETFGDILGTADTVLASGDWILSNDGYSLKRLLTGTHPAGAWAPRVTVVYAAFDDTADRKRVQMELVKLDLNMTPGARSITVGAVSASSGGPTDYPAEREAILASLLADVWTFA